MSNPLGEITASPPNDLPFDGKKESTTVDPQPEPPKKKCNVRDVLPASVIPLVQAAPNNETIRNLLLAHVMVPVPVEEDTYDKIVKWIEFNVSPPPPRKSDVESALERQQIEEQRRAATQVRVSVRASEREHGRCDYHRDIKGEGEMPLDPAIMVREAAESENADDFFERIQSRLFEIGAGNYLNMETTDDGDDYDNYESEEATDEEVVIQAPGKQALREALRSADPELYRSLFGE